MGLRLFVEPVESDSANKTSNKNRATSPSRADLRRQSRPDVRGRRHAIRRAGVRIYSPTQRPTGRNARERLLPWVESPPSRPQDPIGSTGSDRRSGMLHELLRELGEGDERRRERFQERIATMTSLLNGSSWRDSLSEARHADHEHMSEGVDLGWWSGETSRLPRIRRRSRQTSSRPQVDRFPDGPLPVPPPPRRTHPHQSHDSATHREGDLPAIEPRLVRSLNARQMMPNRRAALGMDGLGDRERSLSPEVWDTLLSTLTPDPQPASAGSSFASVAASQTAAPSSGTPTTAPDLPEESPLDAPCESGCENSDMEMDDSEHYAEHYSDPSSFMRMVLQRQEAAHMAATNQPPFGTSDYGMDDTRRFSPTSRASRQINTANGPLTIYESTGRLGQLPGPSRPANNALHNIWVGRVSAGASGEDDSGQDRPRRNQEEPTSATHANPMAAEDDWAGMQRIVSSIVRREDVPDDWWADAGLTRTLRQEESSTASGSTLRQDA